MFKKPSRRQFIMRRVLVTLLATALVVGIVTVTILFMLGYRLDSGLGRLQQGALLQFDSTPNSADVAVDGVAVSGRTATKQTVVAGSHTVTMNKDGYETWSRTLSLQAGTLTWLDYIRLVPKVRTAQSVSTYQNLVDFSVSPDLKWALAQEKADSPSLQLIDLRSEAIKTSTLTLPGTLYSGSASDQVTHQFSLYSWNTGGRYILIRHTSSVLPSAAGSDHTDATTASEWLMVDTQDISRSVNITRLLSVDFDDIQFTGTGGTTLFGRTSDGVVRKLDVSAGTLSRSLLTNVESFAVFDANIISYVGRDPSNNDHRVAGVYRDGEDGSTILATQTDLNVTMRIAAGRYYGDDYVALTEGSALTILSGSFPSAGNRDATSLSTFATISLPATSSAVSFSPEGDYVVAQSGAQFVSYELEHKRAESATIAISDASKVTNLQWLGNHHLWNDADGNLTMRDFNGINTHTIMQVAPGFDANLSQNGRFIYGIAKTSDGYSLQRVKMILD